MKKAIIFLISKKLFYVVECPLIYNVGPVLYSGIKNEPKCQISAKLDITKRQN